MRCAACRASVTSFASIRSLICQPTIALEYRSITVAKYNQPAVVCRYVMSPTQYWLGLAAVKSRLIKFGEMRKSWFESVVCLNVFGWRARRFKTCIQQETVRVLTACPLRRMSCTSFGAPARALCSMKLVLNPRALWLLPCAETTFADPKRRAAGTNAEFVEKIGHGGIPHFWCLAKYADAFFRISLTSLRCLTSASKL